MGKCNKSFVNGKGEVVADCDKSGRHIVHSDSKRGTSVVRIGPGQHKKKG